jgi:diguanylate cyclase (GGDEF)-like protein
MERALDSIPTRRAELKRISPARSSFERVMLVGSDADARRLERLTRNWIAADAWVRAATLEEALVLLGQYSFDVVLTDWWLPDCAGQDPVARLRRVSTQVPIIVLSSAEDLELSEQALQAGAQEVLSKKDLDGKQLLRAMRHSRERQRAQAHLQHGALHDELTSLAKRTLLSQRIANALARSRRSGNTFALIYIDLDHFKSINDTHGHDVGDAVLVAVSHRLKAAVREYDTVARLGGDEFAILLDTLDDAAEAEVVAQRVLQSLAPPVRVACQEVGVTASMGISVFPEGGDAEDTLLRSADLAMYSAKRAGRNTYSLTPVADNVGLLPAEVEPTVTLQCNSSP